MSNEKQRIMRYILRSLGHCNYLYRSIIDGCYEAAVNNAHYKIPPEGKEDVIDSVVAAMNALYNS